MNDNLCQECQEREHTLIVGFDPVTGIRLDCPKFLCSICDRLHMTLNGWVQGEDNNWTREPKDTLYLG